MTITNITIITGNHGYDQLILYTDLPYDRYPYKGVVELEIKVARSNGQNYCKNNFPNIETKIVEVKCI